MSPVIRLFVGNRRSLARLMLLYGATLLPALTMFWASAAGGLLDQQTQLIRSRDGSPAMTGLPPAYGIVRATDTLVIPQGKITIVTLAGADDAPLGWPGLPTVGDVDPALVSPGLAHQLASDDALSDVLNDVVGRASPADLGRVSDDLLARPDEMVALTHRPLADLSGRSFDVVAPGLGIVDDDQGVGNPLGYLVAALLVVPAVVLLRSAVEHYVLTTQAQLSVLRLMGYSNRAVRLLIGSLVTATVLVAVASAGLVFPATRTLAAATGLGRSFGFIDRANVSVPQSALIMALSLGIGVVATWLATARLRIEPLAVYRRQRSGKRNGTLVLSLMLIAGVALLAVAGGRWAAVSESRFVVLLLVGFSTVAATLRVAVKLLTAGLAVATRPLGVAGLLGASLTRRSWGQIGASVGPLAVGLFAMTFLLAAARSAVEASPAGSVDAEVRLGAADAARAIEVARGLEGLGAVVDAVPVGIVWVEEQTAVTEVGGDASAGVELAVGVGPCTELVALIDQEPLTCQEGAALVDADLCAECGWPIRLAPTTGDLDRDLEARATSSISLPPELGLSLIVDGLPAEAGNMKVLIRASDADDWLGLQRAVRTVAPEAVMTIYRQEHLAERARIQNITSWIAVGAVGIALLTFGAYVIAVVGTCEQKRPTLEAIRRFGASRETTALVGLLFVFLPLVAGLAASVGLGSLSGYLAYRSQIDDFALAMPPIWAILSAATVVVAGLLLTAGFGYRLSSTARRSND